MTLTEAEKVADEMAAEGFGAQAVPTFHGRFGRPARRTWRVKAVQPRTYRFFWITTTDWRGELALYLLK